MSVFKGLLIAFTIILVFYFYVIFKNGIDLNELTFEFSILYVSSCVLILLLIWIFQKGNAKKSTILAIAVVIFMIGVISFGAITKIPEQTVNFQMQLATILGNSPQYKELGINDNHDIESIIFHGAPKRGDFEQISGYVIELNIKNVKHPYYFMCAGTGPGCSEYEQVDDSVALKLIDDFQ